MTREKLNPNCNKQDTLIENKFYFKKLTKILKKL